MKRDKTQLLRENEALFQETLNEFSCKSYDLASVNEIIKRSKFNKGSFYYRFKDKFELYIALIDYIYVIQIDLFKQKGIRLNSIFDISETIELMFVNLIELSKYDKRYYKVIQRLYTDNNSLIRRVKNISTESLFERFFLKLEAFDHFTLELKEVLIALYINFPIDKIISGKINIDNILAILNAKSKTNIKTNTSIRSSNLEKDILDNCNKKINYFVGDFSERNIDGIGFDIFENIQSINKYLFFQKLKSINPFLNTKNLLKRYKKKPIFDYLAVNKLLGDKVYNEIKNDDLLKNITNLLVYAIINLNEYIVLKDFVNHLTYKQRDLLFNIIIPITGKLSKIIILDSYLYANKSNLYNFLILDSINNIKKLELNINFTAKNKSFNIQYKKNNIFYNEYFDNYNEIIILLNKKDIEILSIKTTNVISYLDLIESR
ncbi:MAG: TetR/AcrR family transcriptional regulator [Bacillota bacterium]